METQQLGIAAKLGRRILLPIREAYEWKRGRNPRLKNCLVATLLLPIREAYEWKPLNIRINAKII